jgi:hypothetical protein
MLEVEIRESGDHFVAMATNLFFVPFWLLPRSTNFSYNKD